MSAFVVSNEHINKIVNWIDFQSMHGRDEYGFTLKAFEKFISSTTAKRALACHRLGRAMIALNAASVQVRYNDSVESSKACIEDYQYSPEMPAQPIAVFKTLECFLYQSCEGNCDKSPLYAALENLKNRIACVIVENISTYKAEKWGNI